MGRVGCTDYYNAALRGLPPSWLRPERVIVHELGRNVHIMMLGIDTGSGPLSRKESVKQSLVWVEWVSMEAFLKLGFIW